jgi:hypothetical protein
MTLREEKVNRVWQEDKISPRNIYCCGILKINNNLCQKIISNNSFLSKAGIFFNEKQLSSGKSLTLYNDKGRSSNPLAMVV